MTTKNRFIAAVGVVITVTIFLAGLWPERQRRIATEAENASLQAHAERLDDYARLAHLHVQVLNLIDAVAAMNYGQAQTLSSTLFDNVRSEGSRTHDSAYRTTLESILSARDEITGQLAQADSVALEQLRRIERQLRQTIGTVPAISV